MSPFCDPHTATSRPMASMRTSCTPTLVTTSATASAPCLWAMAASASASCSTPVDVSLWVKNRTGAGRAASAASTCATSIALPHSNEITSGSTP